jgi:hypothetical protein
MSIISNEPVAATDFAPDPRRHKACLPGKLVYSAKVNDDAIKCYYRACCQCLPPPDAFARTFIDVYTNAVAVNTPLVCCCCCATDNSRILYFDQSPYARPTQRGGCCSPFPWCCAHGFGLCGESLAFSGNVVGCPAFCFGHAFGAFLYCLFPANFLCGLAEGEAEKTAEIINKEVEKYRAAGGKYERMA